MTIGMDYPAGQSRPRGDRCFEKSRSDNNRIFNHPSPNYGQLINGCSSGPAVAKCRCPSPGRCVLTTLFYMVYICAFHAITQPPPRPGAEKWPSSLWQAQKNLFFLKLFRLTLPTRGDIHYFVTSRLRAAHPLDVAA